MAQLKEMTEQIVKVFKEYEKQGTKTWTYKTAAHDLQYQLGSLTKVILQKEGLRYKGDLSEKEIKEKISDELADMLAEILFISHELDIDLTEAWNNMIKSDKKKIGERSE